MYAADIIHKPNVCFRAARVGTRPLGTSPNLARTLFNRTGKLNRSYQPRTLLTYRSFSSGAHNETLSVVAMRVNNPDRSPVGIHG
jgi:hypothetical protein